MDKVISVIPEDIFNISEEQQTHIQSVQSVQNCQNRAKKKKLNTNSNFECFTCNGFYGASYDDPICPTCHAFLFPNPAFILENPLTLDRSSDSDSGNDEPMENGQEHSREADLDGVRQLANVNVDQLTLELQRLSKTDINLAQFPVEVLIHMFKYLDDEISLWSIGQVCRRWRAVLDLVVRHDRWKHFVRLRWPLLPTHAYDAYEASNTSITDWYTFYSRLMSSACCIKCVKQMAGQKIPPQWKESAWRRNRLRSEIKAMRNDPLEGIEAVPLEANFCHWQATIEGPAGSPYEGGLFFLYIQVSETYPLDPPTVRFLTKIYHPNVSRHGDIGIDSLYHNWSLALTINKLLISIQSLLTDPYCDICMEQEIGELYLKNRKVFEEKARVWTVLHAMHDMLPTHS